MRTPRGFTLLEMLVTIAIITTAGIALMGAIQYFYRNNAYLLEQVSALESAQRSLSTSLQNVREASYGDDGSYPITSAATSSITFHSDVDQDGGVERDRIYLSGTTLYRSVTNAGGNPATYSGQPETTSIIATYVANGGSTPIFRYFDSSGTELGSPVNVSLIRSVRVEMNVDLNPNRAPNVFTLSGSATLRNLRSE